MYRKPLVSHIISKLKDGVSDKDIKQDLYNDGWSKEDVEEAFLYSMYPEKLEHFSLKRFLDYEVHIYVAILAIFFSISIFSLVFFQFKAEMRNYNIFLTASPELPNTEFNYGEQPALSNPVFFQKIKKQFIDEKIKFIEADLSSMKVRTYENGEIVKEAPILTKGREGSWWETPAGLYKISKKEKTHFSSMGGVYQPWSMAFQGNFYIHGWPYYEGGKPVVSTYSGGCIRLSDETAEMVYNFAEVGTPILVFEKDFIADDFVYEAKKPILSATQYLSADLLNNFVFLKSGGSAIPIASITKLMTALVATEYINLDKKVSVPKEAIIYTSKSRLKEGQSISVYQLLFPLLLESSNESAETIAMSYGKNSFIRLMNEKAKSIGMNNTHFEDSYGASPENTSTIDDLFMLAKYIYSNRSFIFNISSGKLKSSAYGESLFNDLANMNDFSGDSSFIGGKVGKTTLAKETGLYVFEIEHKGVRRPIVTIVLGSEDRKKDAENILNFLKSSF